MAPNLINPAQLLQCDTVDCRPPALPAAANSIPQQAQSIDYLAKDYDSFLRGMLDLIPSRLPGWTTRTEADLGMALLELFAYVADQLSYYQDRVANEGFLRTAVEYESVRRLLSLIDYQMSPGVAAQVLLEVAATSPKAILSGFQVTTKATDKQAAVVFEVTQERIAYPDLNAILLKSDVAAQSTQAVLDGEFDLFLQPGLWVRLKSPVNAEWAQLTAPIAVNTVLHTTTINFSAPLKGNYQVATAVINGNGVVAGHGERHDQTATGTGLPGQQVALDFAPLTYVQTPSGQLQSSLVVKVLGTLWIEVADFVDSEPTDLHYTLTRDNEGFATVTFGTGQNGRVPDAGEPIAISYRSGLGEAGLVAPGTLTQFQDPDGAIVKTALNPTPISNPEPSFGGVNPESLADAKLLGPETVHRQNRAITAQDYADALLEGVSSGNSVIQPLHAKAQFVWTGSWTTVLVSVDFADRQPLVSVPGRREALQAGLQAKKLAGFDVQVEDAHYAAMHIALVVHVRPEFFARQVRQAVEAVAGPRGFFAPAHFGFGDAVRLSDLYSAVLSVQGVQYITVSRFKRLGDRYPDHSKDGVIDIRPFEIVRCDNELAHPENGISYVRTCGGKEG